MSSIVNKLKASISNAGSGSTNAGPHDSNVANKTDPRVDSDMDHRNNPTSTMGSSYSGTGVGTTGTTAGSTNAGPHNSNLMNKLDPRIDSDMDNRGNPTSSVGGYGQTQHGTTGSGYGGGTSGLTSGGYGVSTSGGTTTTHHPAVGTSTIGSNTGSGYGSNTGSSNVGPHNSNLLNKLDPRVDSDMDNRGNPTSSVGGYGQTQHGTTGTHTGQGYGTSGSHSGLGSGTTGSTNVGPHNSNLMNKLDPRVDSDMDNRGNPTSSVGGYGQTQHGTTGNYGTAGTHGSYGTAGSTNAGPHNSDLMNKLDPRIDSDMDNRGNPTSSVGGYGSTTTGTTTTTTTHHPTSGTSGYSSGSTNVGPHNSNLMNKLDPRVDSDMDNRGNPTSSVGGYGSSGTTGVATTHHDTTHAHHGHHGQHGHHTTTGAGSGLTGTTGSSNAGPHNSNVMNKMDPRVDSDRDHRNDPTSRVGGYGTQQGAYSAGGAGTGGYYGQQQTGSGAMPGSGNAPTTAGPHSSDMMNKLDPRVDSDLDGSKTYGGNVTHY